MDQDQAEKRADSATVRKSAAEFAAAMLARLGFEGALRHVGMLRELQLHRAKCAAERDDSTGLADLAAMTLDCAEFLDEVERLVLVSHVEPAG